MSLKKYMLIDLLILAIVGAVLEGVGTWACFYAFVGSTPTTIFSLLILFMALTRWRWYGLLTIPILAFGNLMGALSLDTGSIEGYKDMFNLQYFLSNLLGLCSSFWIVLVQKKVGTKVSINNTGILVGLLVGMFISYETVRIVSYWVIGGRDMGIVNANFVDIISLVMLIIGCLIIRLQGSLVDVKNKILEDNKERQERQKEHLITFEITDDDIDVLKGVKTSKND